MYIEQLMRAGSGWRYDPAISGGGVLITQNSHVIDKLLWLFGDISVASGHTSKLVSGGVEDHVHAHFEFASGAVGYLDASWSVRHYRTPTIAGWTTWRTPDLYQSVPLDIGGAQYTRQMVDFLAAVRSHSPLPSDVLSALKVQRVIDALYESAGLGGTPINISQ
jgi:predicted dehydrogenase